MKQLYHMFTRNHLVVVALRVNPIGWMFGSIASNTPWEQSILVRLKMILVFSSKALSILVLVQYDCFYCYLYLVYAINHRHSHETDAQGICQWIGGKLSTSSEKNQFSVGLHD